MVPRRLTISSTCLCLVLAISLHPSAASQFSSHVSINTQGTSIHHGVGNPIGIHAKRFFRRPQPSPYENPRQPHQIGYPRIKPLIPFPNEDIVSGNSLGATPWQYNSYMTEEQIPVLPPSPYKVDSPDPESLWPEGLFLPPLNPTYFGPKFERRTNHGAGQVQSDTSMDPYLLVGKDAEAAVQRAKAHGELYFHEIPHLNALLANQELRTSNGLEKHKLGSARKTWFYYRS